MQVRPPGEMGNPRNYQSKKSQRWVKDTTTGKVHENTAWEGEGKGKSKPSNGLAEPKRQRKQVKTPDSALRSLGDEAGWDFEGKMPKMLSPRDMKGGLDDPMNDTFANLFNARAIHQQLGGGDTRDVVNDLAIVASQKVSTRDDYSGNGAEYYRGRHSNDNFAVVADYVGDKNGDEMVSVYQDGQMLQHSPDSNMRYDTRRDKYVRYNHDRGCYEEARPTSALNGRAIRSPGSLRWRKANEDQVKKSREKLPPVKTTARPENLRSYGHPPNDADTFLNQVSAVEGLDKLSKKIAPVPELINRMESDHPDADEDWQNVFNARQVSKWLEDSGLDKKTEQLCELGLPAGQAEHEGRSAFETIADSFGDSYAFIYESHGRPGKGRVFRSGSNGSRNGGIHYSQDGDCYFYNDGKGGAPKKAKATYDDGSPIYDQEDLVWKAAKKKGVPYEREEQGKPKKGKK